MEVRVRFLEIDGNTLRGGLTADSVHGGDVHKDQVLGRLGIEREAGESHLSAWLRVTAEENGLPVLQPCHREISDLLLNDAALSRFMWFLA